MAVEDGAAEGGALDGQVVVEEDFKVDVRVGDVVGEAVDVLVVLQVKRWESGVAVDMEIRS